MKEYIEERAVEIANYIISNKDLSKEEKVKLSKEDKKKMIGISKRTVHKDVTERLLRINPSLASEARKVLDINKSERHIRGGMATKEKYLHLHIS